MIVNHSFLELKVSTLNKWLQNHSQTHFLYKKKEQKRNYYVGRLCDMDDLGLKTITI